MLPRSVLARYRAIDSACCHRPSRRRHATVWDTRPVSARRALFALLVGAISNPADQAVRSALAAGRDHGLVDLALHHRVAGQLAAAYEAAGRPVPPAVAEARQRATLGHLQKLQALGRATRSL